MYTEKEQNKFNFTDGDYFMDLALRLQSPLPQSRLDEPGVRFCHLQDLDCQGAHYSYEKPYL